LLQRIKRYLPIIVLLILISVAYYLGFTPHYFWDKFQQYHHDLKEFVQSHFVLSLFAYTAFYMLFTALAMPGPMFLTMMGGFLFLNLLALSAPP
jgi:uncharacterized membrane protein YdjX (TVP38/TMEM64 family)